MFQSTKQYGHDLGLSCVFRQARANSHCNLLHGYSIGVKLVFECEVLDHNFWVVDFGCMKPIKEYLVRMFDHTLLVAQDDPMLDEITGLAGLGLADVRVVEQIGCEAFAKMIYTFVEDWMYDCGIAPRVWLVSCEVKEHGANSAVFIGDDT